MKRWAAPLAFSALAAYLLAATRRESVNWDEFALLFRTAETLRTGVMHAGGRPGLVALALVPFVRGCQDGLHAVVAARTAWAFVDLAGVAGLYATVRTFGDRRATGAALLACGVLVLTPAWLRWGLQVRTDQAAIAFAIWVAPLLVRARRERTTARELAWTAAAGACAALAYLCTQKGLYVLALGGAVAIADAVAARAPLRRCLLRAAATLGAAGVVLLAYRLAVPLFVGAGRAYEVSKGLGTFAYYRRLFGFRAYVAMAPTLLPHAAALAFVVATLAWALVRRREELSREARVEVALAAVVLALGAAVGLFHAAAFPYFWMTLGLFPAAAIGFAWGPARALVARRSERLARLVEIGAWVLLAAVALPRAVAVLALDTQGPQRDTFAFVARDFSPDAPGFQAEGAFFCRRDPADLPTYFTEHLVHMTQAEVDRLLRAFREEPIVFMVKHRFAPFPAEVRTFWDAHFVYYRDEIMVAGQPIAGRRGEHVAFDVFAPGAYRWHDTGGGAASIAVDGKRVAAGATIDLATGPHDVELLDDVARGVLAIALADPPAPAGPPFYAQDVVDEIDPPPVR